MNAPAYDEIIWSAAFPTYASDEAIRRLKTLLESSSVLDEDFFPNFFDTVVAEQSKLGVRLHKGMPLFWMAASAGMSGDKKKATELMMQAFTEDVLTFGHEASLGHAATSLRRDYGFSQKTLASLEKFIIGKASTTFYPESLVKLYRNESGEDPVAKEGFQGVSDESLWDSQVAQLRQKLKTELRPSIWTSPANETEVQKTIFTILRQIDPNVEREFVVRGPDGKDAKVDFSLYQNKVCVEIKLIKEKGREKPVIDEITADIPFYFRFFKRSLFVVYDACGAINDSDRFVGDLEKANEQVKVLVVKH